MKSERELRLKAELDKEKALTEARHLHDAPYVRAREIGRRVGIVVRQLSLWSLTPLLLAATYLTLPRPFPQFDSGWWKYITPGLLFCLAVLSLVHLVLGTTVKEWSLKIELAVAAKCENLMLRIIKPDGGKSDASDSGASSQSKEGD